VSISNIGFGGIVYSPPPTGVIVGTLAVTFFIDSYPTDLFAGGSFPAALPSPAAIEAAGSEVSVLLALGANTVYVSYTGQKCASNAPAASAVSPSILHDGTTDITGSS
jgi:hypothetical protein